MIRKSDCNPANHKGSIVRWRRYKFIKNGMGGMEAVENGWNEDILMEPMDYQLVLTVYRGPIVLSSREARTVELIDADLWDEECEEKLRKFHCND